MSANREQNQAIEQLGKEMLEMRKQLNRMENTNYNQLRQINYNLEQVYAASAYFPFIMFWRWAKDKVEVLWARAKQLFTREKKTEEAKP